MDSSDIISIIAALISLASFYVALVYSKKSYRTSEYNRFLEYWIEMDDIFIKHPEIHKYFYGNAKDKIPNNENEKEIAICIAERFRDTFQYSEITSTSIPKDHKESYEEYKERIKATAIYQYACSQNLTLYEKKYENYKRG